MKHATSRMLYAHWDALRGARAAPERGEIEPGEIRHILADCFLLELDASARAGHLRLAGTRLCALFGRELRGAPFAALFGAGPITDPWRFLEPVVEETAGIVAGLSGRTGEGEEIDLEMLTLPLRHRGKTQSRAIGALSVALAPSWIGLRPLETLAATSVRVLVPGAETAFAEAPPERAARRHGLVLHRGGLA